MIKRVGLPYKISQQYYNFFGPDRLQNGKDVSSWTEEFAEQLRWQHDGEHYIFQRTKSNTKGTDGILTDRFNRKKELTAACRSLTKHGIRFQLSTNIGSHRKCSNTILLDFLQTIDYYIVCDIQYAAQESYFLYWFVPAAMLIEEVKSGRLTHTGWKAHRFYEFLICNGYEFPEDLNNRKCA